MADLTYDEVILTASRLLSDNDSNREYDRALTELVTDLLGLTQDDQEIIFNMLKRVASRTTHNFERARFTGNMCCTKCNLVPLDEDDTNSECTGEQQ